MKKYLVAIFFLMLTNSYSFAAEEFEKVDDNNLKLIPSSEVVSYNKLLEERNDILSSLTRLEADFNEKRNPLNDKLIKINARIEAAEDLGIVLKPDPVIPSFGVICYDTVTSKVISIATVPDASSFEGQDCEIYAGAELNAFNLLSGIPQKYLKFDSSVVTGSKIVELSQGDKDKVDADEAKAIEDAQKAQAKMIDDAIADPAKMKALLLELLKK